MPKLLVKLLEMLDDTPAEYGKRQRGQSAVEMALITPILIVLFASMVEIGWFANNYLTLLDATRAGARVATGLQDTRSPLQWDNRASHIPNDWIDAPYEMPLPSDPDEAGVVSTMRFNYRSCPPPETATGFYNEVACRVISAMDPLPLRNDDAGGVTSVDDLVISAFALEIVNGQYLNDALQPVGPGRPIDVADGNVPQAVVVGRYPTNANECEIQVDPTQLLPLANRERDPFDFDGDGEWDVAAAPTDPDAPTLFQVNGVYQEVEGFDDPATTVADAEKQVGFIWYGNRGRTDDDGDPIGCLGSQWTIAEVEELFNMPDFFGTSATTQQRELMASQGIVMVELFWEHKPLLNLPFWEPIYEVFGDRTTVSVWAAFPLPQVEPFILFTP